MRRPLYKYLFLVLALLCSAASAAESGDPVVYSFTFFGCNRLDGKGVKHTGSTSTANVAQLLQSFRDIAALPQKPRYLFMAGDVVKAEVPGNEALKAQLQAWVNLVTDKKYNPLLKQGVRMVAFTGNHEMLLGEQSCKTCAKKELPNPPAYSYWQSYMDGNNPAGYDFIAASNGPVKGGNDGLQDDERRLSYSFRDGDVMFIILNTDSYVGGNTIGDVPLEWIKQQLQAAQRDSAIHDVFVMGHKPLQSKQGDDDSTGDPGNRTILPKQAVKLYRLLNDPMGDGSPTKVRAYLAAHSHEWKFTSGPKMRIAPGKVPQIIAGNGGSPPNNSWKTKAKGAYFGFTLVQITRGGTVTATSYGRDFDRDHYYKQSPVGKTTQRGKVHTLYVPPKAAEHDVR